MARLAARTTSGPIVMLGTKWPSITSTWIQSAPAASTSWISWPRWAKSADRMDGARTQGPVGLALSVRLAIGSQSS